MGPNCGNFFEIFGLPETAQKISGLLGVLILQKFMISIMY